MKNLTKIIIPIAVLITLFFTACEPEEQVQNIEPTKDEALAKEADEIIAELSKTITIGGLEMMNRAEYESLPKAQASELPNLTQDDIQTRASWRVLPTPDVANQGNEGSCVSFAIGYVGVSYYLHRLKGMSYTRSGALRSPEFLYNNTKISTDCQSGSYLRNVLNFLTTNGVCSWSQMTYSSSNGCSNRGSSTQWSQANVGKIKSWTMVSNSVNNLRDLINRGYPVLMGFQLDDRFFTQTKYYPYTYTSKGGRNQGGHAVAIIGYDDDEEVFIVQNSWGDSTHDEGYFYISYDLMPYIAAELYVINPVI